jgi:predicted MPP superfamily phosphohydrolase
MKSRPINRRRFLASCGAACAAAPFGVAAEAGWLEPTWLEVRQLRIGDSQPSHRLVHFTDLHYKGDRAYAEDVVNRINSLSPDFVCFTGDIIENARFLPEALEILSGIKSPMYGVPGNHDYWSRAPFGEIAKCFAATGGAWLLDQQRVIAGGLNIVGVTCLFPVPLQPLLRLATKNILLMHYPAWIKRQAGCTFDLVLAGHSHGGQVRIPFGGAIILPFGVGEYDLGLYQTQAGPLNVSSGIGWYHLPVRFNCRPEIVLIEI